MTDRSKSHGDGSPALAHVIGLCGANILVGTLCIWSLQASGYLQFWALSPFPALVLSSLGGLLMLAASRLLPRQRASLDLRSTVPTRAHDRYTRRFR